MNSLIWIIVSYFLGSIPCGYIISKVSGKNVLEIGWRKSSGSNVFRNVGKLQGILTGILDVTKGFLAVWLAKKIGFSPQIQVLSGVAVVAGNNWSIFLKMAGGRGIGTFAGVLLALSPKILGISLIVPLIVAFVWNASIGTILLLILLILFSFYYNQFETVGFLTLLSLFPIFFKRLSPIKELKEGKNKKDLIINRLIFDDDYPYLELRIKRILEKRGWFERKE